MKHISDSTYSARHSVLENLRGGSAELGLLYCGSEDCDPGHRFGPNKRNHYLLHFIKSGRGVLEIYDNLYELGAGDVFLIPPYAEAWYEADLEKPWSYMWIGFEGFKCDEYIINAGFTSESPVHKIECIEQISAYIEGIMGASQFSLQDELRRNGILLLMFSLLIEDYRHNILGEKGLYKYSGSVYVNNAIEYIIHNFNKKINIGEMADNIGVNRSYLTSCFKSIMGCSPQNYLINFRMEKAKSLLATTNMQVSIIANTVGYKDQLAFSKIFKRQYGISPKSFREARRDRLAKSEKDMDDQ